MNLFDLGQTIEGYASLDIQNTACSKVLSPLSSCQKCQDICPAQALTFADGSWSANQCVGCGLCVIACPNHVFRLDEDTLLQTASEDQPLLVSCKHNPAPQDGGVVINCLQQLYPELILRLLPRTQKLVLYADKSICDQCPQHWYAPGLPQQLSVFGLPLDNFMLITDPKDLAEKLPVQKEPSRRAFFRQLFHETKTSSQKTIVQSAENLLADLPTDVTLGDTPAVLPILRAPLRSLYAEQTLTAESAEQELPYRLPSIDYCTFCGACTSLCPTGALSLHTTQDDSSKQLLFSPLLCTQCQLCQDICLHKKFYWSDRMTIAQLLAEKPLALAQSPEKECLQCEHAYWQYPDDGTDICPFCRK